MDIICVITSNNTAHKRTGIANTWFKTVPNNIRKYFVIGVPGTQLYLKNEEIRVDADDSYLWVTRKLIKTLEVLSTQDFERAFICDDDTYAHPQRLIEIDQEHQKLGNQYVGQEIRGANSQFEPYASGGAGYLITKTAIEKALHDRWFWHVSERCDQFDVDQRAGDQLLGNALRKSGIKVTHDHRFQSQPQLQPMPDNNIATCHYMSPEMMLGNFSLLIRSIAS